MNTGLQKFLHCNFYCHLSSLLDSCLLAPLAKLPNSLFAGVLAGRDLGEPACASSPELDAPANAGTKN
jgi:hypothetical protein